jgi:transposase-like protein
MCELGPAHMNPTENTSPRKYKRYDEAFKRQAVEHWLLSGKSARIVAVELGINVQSLHQWKQQFKALPAGQVAGTLEALQAENRRLQKELRRVAQQRDILKKTLGIISEPSESGLNG